MQMTECINYLLSTVQRKVHKDMSCVLSPFDVTPAQYGVLSCIWQDGLDNPKAIADALKIETASITNILERMENKGLILRRINKDDRRFVIVELTEKGLALEEPILQTVEKFNLDTLALLTQEEQAVFKKALGVLVNTAPVPAA